MQRGPVDVNPRPLVLAMEAAPLLGCLGTSALAVGWVIRRPYSLERWTDTAHAGLLAALLIAIALELHALVAWWKSRASKRLLTRSWFRRAFCAVVLATVAYLTLLQPFKPLYLVLYWGVIAGGISALPWLEGLSRCRHGRRAELVAFNLCVILLGLELGLRAAARVSRSPLLARPNSIEDTIVRNRLEPGLVLFGTRCNRQGFNDEEWDTTVRGARVALIGDSFVVGIVPRELHFSSVAERLLEDVRIDCLGISGAGPGEYVALAREAKALEPDMILMTFFVGNDFEDALRFRPSYPALRSWFDRSNILVASVARRLRAVLAEQARHDGRPAAGQVQGQDRAEVIQPGQKTVQDFPWTLDVMLEQPTFSEEAFLEVERHRLMGTCSPDDGPVGVVSVIAALDEFAAVCGDTPFGVLILPDEFQIEDELWESLPPAGGRWDRDQPQRVLTKILRERKVLFLDLTEPLRKVTPLEDGRRHVYHLRDTHLNARGNEVVGRALAEFLAARLR